MSEEISAEIFSFVQRVAPSLGPILHLEQIPSDNGMDTWDVECAPGRVILRGNNAIAIAGALTHYLRHVGGVEPLSSRPLADPPPTPEYSALGTSPHRWRYHLNYVTYNYSMSWWDWPRWEREIDWMALHGINMPLALTGQDAIWQRVYRSFGLTDKELAEFFPGPAYLAWHWLGCLDGWGGPLPQSWIDDQLALQHKILDRQRALGMTPVLPAFNGHVPSALARVFPEAQFANPQWTSFPAVTNLSPDDPLFIEIGKRFITEYTAEFGTDHVYSADAFIEMRPPSNHPVYLRQVAASIYESMAAADQEAIWLMQGWMFHFVAEFWQPRQIESFLSGVADDRMIILDLWSEMNPVWQSTNGYHGKPWLWCMVHNFGGNHSIFGTLPRVAAGPAEARRHHLGANMQGTGLTMEDTLQNPVMYDLFTDHTWTADPIDLDSWLPAWVTRRYGQQHPDALLAWEKLRFSAYSAPFMKTGGGARSMATARPNLAPMTLGTNVEALYDPRAVIQAAALLAFAAKDLRDIDEYQYDLVDVTRQVLANHANELHAAMCSERNLHNQFEEVEYREAFLSLLDDLDRLLATRSEFLLGTWLEDARARAHTADEANQYEQNARNLITLWHDAEHSQLQDYACKQWSGLVSDFYKQRWLRFFAYLDDCDDAGTAPNVDDFNAELRKWEWKWTQSRITFPTAPTGEAVATAISLLNKYINLQMPEDTALS